MLESEPKPYLNSPMRGFKDWKKRRPLKLEEIIEKSKKLNDEIDINSDELEFKKVEFANRYRIGLFKKGTNKSHGVVRVVFMNGAIWEGMFKDDEFDGYGR